MPDWLRLLLISIGLLLIQQALFMLHPEWRSGADLYVIWLLLLGAARGPALGLCFALLGAVVMDCSSSHLNCFHLLFYLLPVLLGTLLTSHRIASYNLLGAMLGGGLLLFKIILSLAWGLVTGLLPSAVYLFKLNYLPLVVCMLVIFVFWHRLTRLVETPASVAGGAGFGR